MIAVGGALGQTTTAAQQLVQSGVQEIEGLKWSVAESFLPDSVGAIADITEGMHSLIEAFAPPPTVNATTYSLTIGNAGTGTGTVSASPPGPTYAAGTVVTLTESPSATSTFANWSGAVSATGPSVQITMNGNESETATFNLSSSPWDGTWTGTYSLTAVNGDGCTFNDSGSFSMTISAAGQTISGSANTDGHQCRDQNTCALDDTESSSGSMSGSVTTTTINAEFDGTYGGSSCAGQSLTLSFSGTLSGNTITATFTSPVNGTITLNKR
jgi:hypothetical protein